MMGSDTNVVFHQTSLYIACLPLYLLLHPICPQTFPYHSSFPFLSGLELLSQLYIHIFPLCSPHVFVPARGSLNQRCSQSSPDIHVLAPFDSKPSNLCR